MYSSVSEEDLSAGRKALLAGMDKVIANALDGQPVALFMEPIQANGGMIPFPRPYCQAIRELCDKHDMLLVWDEIQTAFGRVGEMFAAELYDSACF